VLRHTWNSGGSEYRYQAAFGVSATSQSHELDFVVRLERWNAAGPIRPSRHRPQDGENTRRADALDEMPVPRQERFYSCRVAARNICSEEMGIRRRRMSADLAAGFGGRPS